MDQSKKTRRPPKTIKEKKFLQEFIKTGNATEAASRVYDVKNRKNARAIGTETLAKLDITEIMEKKGLTDEKITDTLIEGMEANKTVRSSDPSKESDAESNDFIDIPDWQARLKATELASKIKGHLKDKMIHEGEIKVTEIKFTRK